MALARVLACALLSLLAANAVAAAATGLGAPIVFVSRQILPDGSIYWDAAQGLPGVGPASRVRPAAPGKLLVLETDGTLRTLIDGAVPTPAEVEVIAKGEAVAVPEPGATLSGVAALCVLARLWHAES